VERENNNVILIDLWIIEQDYHYWPLSDWKNWLYTLFTIWWFVFFGLMLLFAYSHSQDTWKQECNITI